MRETSPPLGFHWLRVFLYLGTLLCPPGREPSSARSLVLSRYQQQAVVGVDEGVGYLSRLPSQTSQPGLQVLKLEVSCHQRVLSLEVCKQE